MSVLARIAVIVFVLVAGAAGWLLTAAYRTLDTPMPVPAEGLLFEVASGSSLAAVAQDLRVRELLRHPDVFVWYARLSGRAARIKAGEYALAPRTTPRELLEQLVAGRVHLHAVTLVEGWTFTQVLAALADHPAIAHTLAGVSAEQVMEMIGHPGEHPEGRFFPDTYRFPRGTVDSTILAQAYDAMSRRLEAAWESRAVDLPLENAYQALILASIVEKETALEAERAMIAGVFTRRLRLGMRLQSDPTVIYGLGAGFDGDIRTRDLRSDTPYNTYTRRGLPPTPIGMPGARSLDAAVHPDEGEALYFVATGAGDGSHYFSATLDEHNQAVQRYLQRLAEQRAR